MKLHTGDTVVIITGKDKGKTGTVLRVLPEDSRVIVSGVNIRTRHVKKTAQEAGRIVKFEASLHASNVMLIDPKTKKRSRIGYKVEATGKKRISKVSGEKVVAVRAEKTKKKKTDDTATEDTAKAGGAFWRRKGGPGDNADTKEGSHMSQDKSIPEQNVHVRGGSRGS